MTYINIHTKFCYFYSMDPGTQMQKVKRDLHTHIQTTQNN